MFRGRITPAFSGVISDPEMLRRVQDTGYEWGGVRFYFDRWIEFELPQQLDENGRETTAHKTFTQAVANGHLEVEQVPA